MELFERLQTDLERRKAQGNYRELPMVSYRQDDILLESPPFIDMASNDYLCVARDSSLVKDFFDTFTDKESSGSQFAQIMLSSFINPGSTGSRLLTGNHIAYTYCEDLLASLFSRSVSCPWDPNDSNMRNGIGNDRQKTDAHIRNNSNNSFASFNSAQSPLEQDLSYAMDLNDPSSMVNAAQDNGFAREQGLGQDLNRGLNQGFSPELSQDDSGMPDLGSDLGSDLGLELSKTASLGAGADVDNVGSSVDALSDMGNMDDMSSMDNMSTLEGMDDMSSMESMDNMDGIDDSALANGVDGSSVSALDSLTGVGNSVFDVERKQAQRTYGNAGSVTSLDQQSLARDCLYLNSGFDANSGIISTLFNEQDLLLVDKLSHASIIDGMLQSKAKSMRFAHNDMKHLERLLEAYAAQYANVVIITESVFSMDGDRANLQEIVAFKKRFPNVLVYVDEAHSFGLLGEGGLGLCQELQLLDQVDFIMGTLSKAIGSQGAFLICPRVVKHYLINYMRNFIYSTALPPFNVAFSMYIIGLLNTTTMQYRRDYLNKICNYLHLNLLEMDLKPSESQIQPLITGDNNKAVYMSEVFQRAGLLALPIRHPTVPLNKVRLRLTLNCNLRIEDIDLVCSLIKRHRKMFI